MSDLDVSFRLRLVNDLSKEAKRAQDDLKKLDRAVDGLGKGGNNQLDKELRGIANAARAADKPVKDLAVDAKKLDRIKTNSAEREIKALGTASKTAGKNVWGLETEIRKLSRANTDAAEREIKALGTASDNARARVRKLDNEIDGIGKNNKLASTEASVSGLRSSIGLVGNVAKGAMVGLLSAIALRDVAVAIDDVASKYRNLEADVARTQNTLEMRDPATRRRIMNENRDLSLRYGLSQPGVNEARDVLTGANVTLDSQSKLLGPIVKAAMASGSSPEDMAKAVVALRRNLGVKDGDVATALDMMMKAANLGGFELGDMAKNFPTLAAMYGQTGRTGTDAVAELVSYLQVVLDAAGTPDEAATNLKGYFDKIYSPDAEGNFKDVGSNLPGVRDRAAREDRPFPDAVLDELERISGGDQFKINKLFGDRETKLAVLALLNRKRLAEILNSVKNESAGSVDTNWREVEKTDQNKTARQDAAFEDTGYSVGKKSNEYIVPFWERMARNINSAYANMRWLEELPQIESASKKREAEIEGEIAKLRSQQQDMGDGGTSLGPRINQLRAELDALREEAIFRQEEVKRLRGEGAPVDPTTTNSIGDKPVKASSRNSDYVPSGNVPIPLDRPVDMSGAAERSMNGYNDALRAAGRDAEVIVQGIATKLKSILNFTATPTISPNMVNPGNSTAKVPGKQSSVTTTTPTKVTQNITTPSAVRAARLAQREQDRAVRQARARAYADMGSMPA